MAGQAKVTAEFLRNLGDKDRERIVAYLRERKWTLTLTPGRGSRSRTTPAAAATPAPSAQVTPSDRVWRLAALGAVTRLVGVVASHRDDKTLAAALAADRPTPEQMARLRERYEELIRAAVAAHRETERLLGKA